MKKSIVVISFMMLSFIVFSQSATIDGVVCTNSVDCPKYVCENATRNLVAGITSGSVDSVVWRERIWNGSAWSAYTTIGKTITISVPFGEAANVAHTYRYQLIVYTGGTMKYALSDMYVNSAPTVTLLSSETAICSGALVTFTASSGGTNYDFKVNGSSFYSGGNSFASTTALTNGDNITVTITGSNTCTATSAPISMTVHQNPQATSVVGNLPTPAACPGSLVPVTITGLTGTGPWHLEVWNTVGGIPTSLHIDAGTTNNPNPTINVPVYNVGQNPMFLKVSDAFGCHN